jgi:hypothetical protein
VAGAAALLDGRALVGTELEPGLLEVVGAVLGRNDALGRGVAPPSPERPNRKISSRTTRITKPAPTAIVMYRGSMPLRWGCGGT